MSGRLITEGERKTAAVLGAMTADDLADWLVDGFRTLAGAPADGPAFGALYAYLQSGQDITEDIAAVFELLAQDKQASFHKSLNAAVRRLSPRDPVDQRALVFALRLGARINAYSLLPLIIKKTFPADGDPEADMEAIQAQAIDVAIELATGSPNSIESLFDIINSNAFQAGTLASKAPALLLALCDADSRHLLEHLMRLEDHLAQLYGEGVSRGDGGLERRRAQLLVDLIDFTTPSVIGGVVDYALINRDWRLAWFGEILIELPDVEGLSPMEWMKAEDMRKKLLKGTAPATPPDWAIRIKPRHPSRTQYREASEILAADDDDQEAQEGVYRTFMAILGPSHSPEVDRQVRGGGEFSE